MSLKKLRKQAGFSLHGLAGISGINYMKIYYIETGRIKMESIICSLARAVSWISRRIFVF